MNQPVEPDPAPESHPARLPYRRPRLRRHGDMVKLTRKVVGIADAGMSLSDREAKRAIRPVDVEAVLAAALALPIATWSYLGEAPTTTHMGPMAQDFAGHFGLGDDPRRIANVDAQGVALAAIQGLHRGLRTQVEQIGALGAELEVLRARVAELEAERAKIVR
ncbi:MAG: hypothetical protein NVS9B1_18330 [Candidatus Dormibacteraceae bacterium]